MKKVYLVFFVLFFLPINLLSQSYSYKGLSGQLPKDLSSIETLLAFARHDKEQLEEEWLVAEAELTNALRYAKNDFEKKKLLEEGQKQQELIEQKIDEVEMLILQLELQKELVLNPPPKPLPALEVAASTPPIQEEQPRPRTSLTGVAAPRPLPQAERARVQLAKKTDVYVHHKRLPQKPELCVKKKRENNKTEEKRPVAIKR